MIERKKDKKGNNPEGRIASMFVSVSMKNWHYYKEENNKEKKGILGRKHQETDVGLMMSCLLIIIEP